uniref:Uncharacterized protein n=1 Tax=Oncorhynchus tshawytscha TaxID=74940 RepID=A0AAZ3SL55_ONCTS
EDLSKLRQCLAILACKSWWDKQKTKMLDASKATTQHNTKQYINCTITVTNGAHKLRVPTAVPTPYNCCTLLSAEPCQAAKQFIQPHLLPPEVVLYPEDEVDLERSSSLICSGVRDTGDGSSASPAVFSGVGLTQGLLWVATGTFLLINGSQCI